MPGQLRRGYEGVVASREGMRVPNGFCKEVSFVDGEDREDPEMGFEELVDVVWAGGLAVRFDAEAARGKGEGLVL